MSFRRFVNLVSSDSLKRVYALRRIDMSRFFPTAASGTMQQQDYSALPDPVINFYSPQAHVAGCGDMDFMLVDDKVVATDGTGGAFIYDTGKHAVRSLPGSHARFKTKYTTSLTVGSDLYVIERLTNGTGTRNFEALSSTRPRPTNGTGIGALSRCLASRSRATTAPASNPAPRSPTARVSGCPPVAVAVARGRGRGGGADKQSCTHLFDTQNLVWSKQPADWMLPFVGNAQYVPELQNLWFGISTMDYGHAFCAADLATASLSRPPAMRAVFDDGIAPAGVPKDRLITAHAVHLGSGRFCIARFFSVSKKPEDGSQNDLGTYDLDYDYDEELFVVVAGVEVVSGGDGELSLVKHGSELYMILDYI